MAFQRVAPRMCVRARASKSSPLFRLLLRLHVLLLLPFSPARVRFRRGAVRVQSGGSAGRGAAAAAAARRKGAGGQRRGWIGGEGSPRSLGPGRGTREREGKQEKHNLRACLFSLAAAADRILHERSRCIASSSPRLAIVTAPSHYFFVLFFFPLLSCVRGVLHVGCAGRVTFRT